MKHGNLAVFVPHVGCPHRCSFCDQRAITGGAEPPGEDFVRLAAQQAAEALGPRVKETEIAFFGGSFTAVPTDYMLSLLTAARWAVKEFGFMGIRCSTRPDAVEEPVLSLLEEYGVTAIELGAQSMDDEVLSANGRGHTADQTAEAAGRIKAHGFELGLQMMTGLFGATVEKDVETVERMIALQPDTARIYPTVVLEGTELAQLYRQGRYRPQTLEEAVDLCATLLPRLEAAGIRVIKVGLHAERSVEERRIAGPYHPAFRELVQSRVFFRELLKAFQNCPPGPKTVAVNPRSLSAALGQKRENLAHFQKLGYAVTFLGDESVERGGFCLK